MTDEPITLQEIGDHFSISRERARQIEKVVSAKVSKILIGKKKPWKPSEERQGTAVNKPALQSRTTGPPASPIIHCEQYRASCA